MHKVLRIPELVLYILSFYLLDEADPPYKYYVKLMTIASCCWQWRNMVTTTPHLWRYIVFDGKKMRKRFTDLAIRRSGEYALRLIVAAKSKRKDYLHFVCHISRIYASQIEHITIISSHKQYADEYTDILYAHKMEFTLLKDVKYVYLPSRSGQWEALEFYTVEMETSDGNPLLTWDEHDFEENVVVMGKSHPRLTAMQIATKLHVGQVEHIMRDSFCGHICCDNVTKMTLTNIPNMNAIFAIQEMRNIRNLEINGLHANIIDFGLQNVCLTNLKSLKLITNALQPNYLECSCVLTPHLERLELVVSREIVTRYLDLNSPLENMMQATITCPITGTIVDHAMEMVAVGADVKLICKSRKKICRCKHHAIEHPEITLVTCR
jgi:hypothetical protein